MNKLHSFCLLHIPITVVHRFLFDADPLWHCLSIFSSVCSGFLCPILVLPMLLLVIWSYPPTSHARITAVCISVSFVSIWFKSRLMSSFFFLCLLLTPASFLNHPISAVSILCSSSLLRVKPEVEFQYGGRLFLATGSSNISAADWDIWSQFGRPTALDLPKCQTWPNPEPEVDLRHYGRRLLKLIWRHNSVGDHPICIKFGRPVQNYMPIIV